MSRGEEILFGLAAVALLALALQRICFWLL
jgi:hypothetical protein